MRKSACFRHKVCRWLLVSNGGTDKSKDRFGCAWGQMRKTMNKLRKLPVECKARYYRYKKCRPDKKNKVLPICLQPMR